MNIVTAADAVLYHHLVTKWQALLNLQDWRIVRSPKQIRSAMSDISISVEDHCALYRLGKNFGDEEVNLQSLESTACHELLHVLLAELITMAQARVPDDVLMAMEHRIVITLEKLLVPKI
jgi:hypothetical protein